MSRVIWRALLFAVVAFALLLAIDALLSLVYQSPPTLENRKAYLLAHGAFHTAVLVLSALGAVAGFAFLRAHLPRPALTVGLAAAFAIVTVMAGPGSLLLGGVAGLIAWLFLGSLSFSLGASVFSRPWRRPTL